MRRDDITEIAKHVTFCCLSVSHGVRSLRWVWRIGGQRVASKVRPMCSLHTFVLLHLLNKTLRVLLYPLDKKTDTTINTSLHLLKDITFPLKKHLGLFSNSYVFQSFLPLCEVVFQILFILNLLKSKCEG